MRYLATFQMYIWGDNKRDALKEAELLVKILNYQYDSSPRVVELKTAEFGEIEEAENENFND